MCSHYQGVKQRERFFRAFGFYPPEADGAQDVWPGYHSLLIRRPRHADVGDDAVPDREALSGVFGLLPHWARDQKLARSTFNARTETVAAKPSFRDAWQRGQHCIVPAEAIYEPDWRSGRALATRISRSDGEPMGIAGLWSWWKPPGGDTVHSFTMLTINADQHSLMRNFHRPGEEKRMVVVLPEAAYNDWLQAAPQRRVELLQPYPAQLLQAEAAAPADQAKP